jgi:hypothetical protein
MTSQIDKYNDSTAVDASVAASEKTQEWLDAIWTKAMQNERS